MLYVSALASLLAHVAFRSRFVTVGGYWNAVMMAVSALVALWCFLRIDKRKS